MRKRMVVLIAILVVVVVLVAWFTGELDMVEVDSSQPVYVVQVGDNTLIGSPASNGSDVAYNVLSTQQLSVQHQVSGLVPGQWYDVYQNGAMIDHTRAAQADIGDVQFASVGGGEFKITIAGSGSGSLLSSDAQLRVNITAGEMSALVGWTDFMFINNPAVTGSTMYVIPDTPGAVCHLVPNLVPGVAYNIYQDGVLLKVITAYPNGVVGFISTGGGRFEVTQGAASQDPSEPGSPEYIEK